MVFDLNRIEFKLNTAPDWIIDLFRFIRINIEGQITLQMLCDRCGRSEDQIRKAVAEFTGLGVLEFIHFTKFQLVRRALCDSPDCTVKEVLDEFSIVNQGRFSKEYHQIYNEYPKETKAAAAAGFIPIDVQKLRAIGEALDCGGRPKKNNGAIERHPLVKDD